MFQETGRDGPVFLKAAGVQNIPESRHSDVQMLTVWKSTFELTVKHNRLLKLSFPTWEHYVSIYIVCELAFSFSLEQSADTKVRAW